MSIKDIFFDEMNIQNLVDVLKKETDIFHYMQTI